MSATDTAAPSRFDRPAVTVPLPEKIAQRIHEARWLLFGALGFYLALILGGFDRADPGWSHASAVEAVKNPGGLFGAWKKGKK